MWVNQVLTAEMIPIESYFLAFIELPSGTGDYRKVPSGY